MLGNEFCHAAGNVSDQRFDVLLGRWRLGLKERLKTRGVHAVCTIGTQNMEVPPTSSAIGKALYPDNRARPCSGRRILACAGRLVFKKHAPRFTRSLTAFTNMALISGTPNLRESKDPRQARPEMLQRLASSEYRFAELDPQAKPLCRTSDGQHRTGTGEICRRTAEFGPPCRFHTEGEENRGSVHTMLQLGWNRPFGQTSRFDRRKWLKICQFARRSAYRSWCALPAAARR